MQNVNEITLSLDSINSVKVYAKQGDHNSRKLKIILTSNGNVVKPNSDEEVVMRFIKQDGKSGMNPLIVDENGKINADLTDQMLAVAGDVYCDIFIKKGVEVISTATFTISVSKVPMSENQLASSNEFLYLKNLDTRVENSLKESESFAHRAETAAVKAEKVIVNLDAQPGVFSPAVGENKWNSAFDTKNQVLNWANGTLYSAPSIDTSDYIDVSERAGKEICIYSCYESMTFNLAYFRLAFYDLDKKFISGKDNNGHQVGDTNAVVNVPKNASYVRVSINNDKNTACKMLVFKNHPIRGEEYKETFYKVEQLDKDIKENSKKIKEGQRDHIKARYKFAKNRFDSTKVKNGFALDINTGEFIKVSPDAADKYGVSDFIPVMPNENIFFSILNTVGSQFVFMSNCKYAFYDVEKKFLCGGNTSQNALEYPELIVPEHAEYVVFATGAIKDTQRKYIISSKDFYPTINSMLTFYEPYSESKKVLPNELLDYEETSCAAAGWKGKTALFYGDSITAIGNTYDIDSWERFVADALKFKKYYVNGIGGQTYKKNNKPWFANFDGSYHSRNDNADITNPSSYTVPSGTTAHYGYMASWDRIKTQIPDSIKDSIDLIFLFGVNDGSDTSKMSIPKFINGDSKDEAWSTAPENKLGGDYNINDLNGAIASTLMKLQARCPNAVIVTGTGWSGRTEGETLKNSAEYDSNGLRIWNEGRVVKQISEYFSIPCVDIWANTGVNPWNREIYLADSIHPYKLAGKKALARAVINGLKLINPKN